MEYDDGKETNPDEMDKPIDWMEETRLNPALDRHNQATLSSWIVEENVPEGRTEDEVIQKQVGKSRTMGEGGCVITQTGSVGVAAPQSNIVLKDTEKIPDGWKGGKVTTKNVKRRVRGKLDKKEIIAMKAVHADIGTLLAAQKQRVEPEEDIAVDDLAILEREERLELAMSRVML